MEGRVRGCCRARKGRGNPLQPGELLQKGWKLGKVSRTAAVFGLGVRRFRGVLFAEKVFSTNFEVEIIKMLRSTLGWWWWGESVNQR